MIGACKTEIMGDTIDRDCACSLELGGPRKRKQQRNTPYLTLRREERKRKKGRKKVRGKRDITTKDGAEGYALVWRVPMVSLIIVVVPTFLPAPSSSLF